MNQASDQKNEIPHRNWWQFSLRTLMLLMLLSIFGFAYYSHQLRRERIRKNAIRIVEALDCKYTWDQEDSNLIHVQGHHHHNPLLDDQFLELVQALSRMDSVSLKMRLSQTQFKHLEELQNLLYAELFYTERLTENDWLLFERLPRLRFLHIRSFVPTETPYANRIAKLKTTRPNLSVLFTKIPFPPSDSRDFRSETEKSSHVWKILRDINIAERHLILSAEKEIIVAEQDSLHTKQPAIAKSFTVFDSKTGKKLFHCAANVPWSNSLDARWNGRRLEVRSGQMEEEVRTGQMEEETEAAIFTFYIDSFGNLQQFTKPLLDVVEDERGGYYLFLDEILRLSPDNQVVWTYILEQGGESNQLKILNNKDVLVIQNPSYRSVSDYVYCLTAETGIVKWKCDLRDYLWSNQYMGKRGIRIIEDGENLLLIDNEYSDQVVKLSQSDSRVHWKW